MLLVYAGPEYFANRQSEGVFIDDFGKFNSPPADAGEPDTPVAENQVKCPTCGNVYSKESPFCPECGMPRPRNEGET